MLRELIVGETADIYFRPLSLLKSPKHRESLEISWGRPYHGGHDRDLIHLRFRPLLPPS